MARRKGDMSRTEMLLHTDREAVERALGKDLTDKAEWFFAFAQFNEARHGYMAATLPGLQALQLEQYPRTAAFTHPAALDRIRDTHQMSASGLIWSCRGILQRMETCTDIHATYPRLEEFRAFYCREEVPHTVDRHGVYVGPDDTEEVIRQRVDKENEELRKIYHQRKQQQDAYYDLMQPLLFRYMPQLQELEGDHWVIYAATIRDEYEDWRSMCEQFDATIEYGMPQESISWKYADWHALMSEMYSHRKG